MSTSIINTEVKPFKAQAYKNGQFLAVSFKFGWRCHQRPQRNWCATPSGYPAGAWQTFH